MDFTDFLWLKLIVLAVLAGAYGFWRGVKGLPLQEPGRPEGTAARAPRGSQDERAS